MRTSKSDAFTIERHGDLTVIAATPALERLDPTLEESVAEVILDSVRANGGANVIFDLSGVDYFGSMFVAVLLRCWRHAVSKGGSMALAGVSDHAKELLRITSLDMIWPLYKTRREAMEALLAD
jgi:anti-sigma B factor antagonist